MRKEETRGRKTLNIINSWNEAVLLYIRYLKVVVVKCFGDSRLKGRIEMFSVNT